jgi:hypothetical protein
MPTIDKKDLYDSFLQAQTIRNQALMARTQAELANDSEAADKYAHLYLLISS